MLTSRSPPGPPHSLIILPLGYCWCRNPISGSGYRKPRRPVQSSPVYISYLLTLVPLCPPVLLLQCPKVRPCFRTLASPAFALCNIFTSSSHIPFRLSILHSNAPASHCLLYFPVLFSLGHTSPSEMTCLLAYFLTPCLECRLPEGNTGVGFMAHDICRENIFLSFNIRGGKMNRIQLG